MNKVLFIVRGLPGSGKTTLAKSLGSVHFEADMYFMEGNEYKFDITKIKKAHEWCQNTLLACASFAAMRLPCAPLMYTT